MLDGDDSYYNRFDPSKNFEQHLFIAGPALQSAELNEVQAQGAYRLKAVADSLFRDGDIIRDAVVVVNPTTGVTTCSSGAVYLRGAVRGVPAATITVPNGKVDIGIFLVETVIDAVADVSLKDPAANLLNSGKPGAQRLKVEPVWGYDGDGHVGDFFPIYVTDDRVLRPKAAPPTIDAVTQALAKYDRDSTGGSYVVRGMDVTALPDSGANQVYSVDAGSARANGVGIEFDTSRRLVFDPAPDLKNIVNEPHLSTGTGSQRVDVSFAPLDSITSVSITKQKIVTLTHGAFAGAADALPDPSVVSIVAVNQGGAWGGSSFTGGTNYASPADYTLSGNAVNWAPAGAEPATGSTYQVVYQYITSVAVDSSDLDGFNVTGAVTGTLILATYNQRVPRLDRICLSDAGELVWLKGVATNYSPRPPIVPVNMLSLATVQQTWRTTRKVLNDGVRVVPMQDIAKLNTRIDYVLGLVAQQRLESSLQTRTSGIIKGILTDPFLDDKMRDAGQAQTAAIFNGVATLPIAVTPAFADSRPSGTVSSLTYASSVVIAQTARTGSMKVNPYNAFSVPLVPPEATLSPAIDRWTDVQQQFNTSVVTRLMGNLWSWWKFRSDEDWGFTGLWRSANPTQTETISTENVPASNLRQIPVAFTLTNFTPGETLASMTFDGVAVTATGTAPANGAGVITGTFTIPANVLSGTKAVVFNGSGGHIARTTFVGEGVTVIETHNITQTVFTPRQVDPLAETFTLAAPRQISGVDLWYTAKGTSSAEVQIRETSNGVPTRTILARSRVAPSGINVAGGTTRFNFSSPVFLAADVEYAIVVLSDDAVAEVAIAELGKKDTTTNQWVTAQPYQVGVLLSSSNASTWTAHQDRDLAFQLLAADFTQTSRTIALGTVAVTAATDLAVRANIELPASVAGVKFVLTMPDASQITVGVDQSVRLDAAVTGNIAISAVLTGSAVFSPLLLADVQLLWGVIGTTGTYYSRYITAGTAITAKVVVEAYLPGTSTLTVDVKGELDGGWTNLTGPTAVTMADGWVELTYSSGSLTKNTIATRLTLGGSAAARPAVRNLRLMTV